MNPMSVFFAKVSTVVVLSLLLLACYKPISLEAARKYADAELKESMRRLDVGEGELVGPTNISEQNGEYYFTWVRRDDPSRTAMIIWVSRTGEADTSVVDKEILANYKSAHKVPQTP